MCVCFTLDKYLQWKIHYNSIKKAKTTALFCTQSSFVHGFMQAKNICIDYQNLKFIAQNTFIRIYYVQVQITQHTSTAYTINCIYQQTYTQNSEQNIPILIYFIYIARSQFVTVQMPCKFLYFIQHIHEYV